MKRQQKKKRCKNVDANQNEVVGWTAWRFGMDRTGSNGMKSDAWPKLLSWLLALLLLLLLLSFVVSLTKM